MKRETKIILEFDADLTDRTRERIIETIETALKDDLVFKERCTIRVI